MADPYPIRRDQLAKFISDNETILRFQRLFQVSGSITPAEIAAIQNDILIIQGQIAVIQAQISVIQGQITVIQGQITELYQQDEDLEFYIMSRGLC